MKSNKNILILILIQAYSLSLLAMEPSDIKLQWLNTKIEKVNSIIQIKKDHYQNGLIPLDEYISWEEKLFTSKEESLKIQQQNNIIDQQEYLKNTLLLRIDHVNFYNSQIPNIKSLKEVGLLQEVDLKIFEIYVLEAYNNYLYILEKYKQTYPNEKLQIKLPKNLKNAITKLY